MALASLTDFEVQPCQLIAGFQKDDDDDVSRQTSVYSGNSDENLSSECCSSPSLGASVEDLSSLKRLSKSSENLSENRLSLQQNALSLLYYKLSNLKHQLKENESELRLYNVLMEENRIIDGEILREFLAKNPNIIGRLNGLNNDSNRENSKIKTTKNDRVEDDSDDDVARRSTIKLQINDSDVNNNDIDIVNNNNNMQKNMSPISDVIDLNEVLDELAVSFESENSN
ncbi:hypothetical protein HELRODRAFT_181334 [Helobdella robusta]|uniref:Uncharacterized protein n=1 Tax=Helobdella robusta TaxID=6412 RepID=T1FGW7_HELRO|nr:hypothetical protein HELRODRAFT_181334 [Helobdella robusta]ESN92462.1 hypothetical protein HELRODRAFT_181334 [Helobdella robusta]